LGVVEAPHVFEVLRQHVGRDRSITSIQIARELGFTDGSSRLVRGLIEIHGNVDWPGLLCAAPGDGYYFAADIEDIRQYRSYLATLKKNASAKLKRLDERIAAEGFALEGVTS
jgi:hypothetical protein